MAATLKVKFLFWGKDHSIEGVTAAVEIEGVRYPVPGKLVPVDAESANIGAGEIAWARASYDTIEEARAAAVAFVRKLKPGLIGEVRK